MKSYGIYTTKYFFDISTYREHIITQLTSTQLCQQGRFYLLFTIGNAVSLEKSKENWSHFCKYTRWRKSIMKFRRHCFETQWCCRLGIAAVHTFCIETYCLYIKSFKKQYIRRVQQKRLLTATDRPHYLVEYLCIQAWWYTHLKKCKNFNFPNRILQSDKGSSYIHVLHRSFDFPTRDNWTYHNLLLIPSSIKNDVSSIKNICIVYVCSHAVTLSIYNTYTLKKVAKWAIINL